MNITRKSTIYLVVLATLLAFVNASSIFQHDSEIGLLNYMARANELLQQDPTRSLNCFNKYVPLINEIASNYETNFKACLNESEAATAKADEATLEQRNDLENAAEASCTLLKQCPEENSVEEIFQCYINGGSASIKGMYAINANASQELAALREQYYLIKNEEFKCTNYTKRVYEKESAEAYAGLNNCILGISDIVTTEAPTDAPTEAPTEIPTEAATEIATETPTETPTEATTEAPTESPTEAPQDTTSIEPETSDNPTTTAIQE